MIRIVRRGGHYEKVLAGVTFLLRRLPVAEIQTLEQDHLQPGKEQYLALGIAKLKKMVRGWDGPLVDAEGKRIPYTVDDVEHLPDTIRAELLATQEGTLPLEERASTASPETSTPSPAK